MTWAGSGIAEDEDELCLGAVALSAHVWQWAHSDVAAAGSVNDRPAPALLAPAHPAGMGSWPQGCCEEELIPWMVTHGPCSCQRSACDLH